MLGCGDESSRSCWTEPPEPTRPHPSFWHKEQVILRESCAWRLLNCSWHCLGELRFARKSQAFQQHQNICSQDDESHQKMGSGLCVPPCQGHFPSAFVTPSLSREKDAESSQGHLLHRLMWLWGLRKNPPCLARNSIRSWTSPEPPGWDEQPCSAQPGQAPQHPGAIRPGG